MGGGEYGTIKIYFILCRGIKCGNVGEFRYISIIKQEKDNSRQRKKNQIKILSRVKKGKFKEEKDNKRIRQVKKSQTIKKEMLERN